MTRNTVIIFMTSMPKSIINSPTGAASIYLPTMERIILLPIYDGNTDFKDGSKMNWGNTILSARWNYVFNNRLFCNTTVSYSNYLFDINSYTNNQYFGSSGTSFTNRYSAITVRESMIGITRSTSIIIHLPNTTSNLEQDISIIVSARKL